MDSYSNGINHDPSFEYSNIVVDGGFQYTSRPQKDANYEFSQSSQNGKRDVDIFTSREIPIGLFADESQAVGYNSTPLLPLDFSMHSYMMYRRDE